MALHTVKVPEPKDREFNNTDFPSQTSPGECCCYVVRPLIGFLHMFARACQKFEGKLSCDCSAAG